MNRELKIHFVIPDSGQQDRYAEHATGFIRDPGAPFLREKVDLSVFRAEEISHESGDPGDLSIVLIGENRLGRHVNRAIAQARRIAQKTSVLVLQESENSTEIKLELRKRNIKFAVCAADRGLNSTAVNEIIFKRFQLSGSFMWTGMTGVFGNERGVILVLPADTDNEEIYCMPRHQYFMRSILSVVSAFRITDSVHFAQVEIGAHETIVGDTAVLAAVNPTDAGRENVQTIDEIYSAVAGELNRFEANASELRPRTLRRVLLWEPVCGNHSGIPTETVLAEAVIRRTAPEDVSFTLASGEPSISEFSEFDLAVVCGCARSKPETFFNFINRCTIHSVPVTEAACLWKASADA